VPALATQAWHNDGSQHAIEGRGGTSSRDSVDGRGGTSGGASVASGSDLQAWPSIAGGKRRRRSIPGTDTSVATATVLPVADTTQPAHEVADGPRGSVSMDTDEDADTVEVNDDAQARSLVSESAGTSPGSINITCSQGARDESGPKSKKRRTSGMVETEALGALPRAVSTPQMSIAPTVDVDVIQA